MNDLRCKYGISFYPKRLEISTMVCTDSLMLKGKSALSYKFLLKEDKIIISSGFSPGEVGNCRKCQYNHLKIQNCTFSPMGVTDNHVKRLPIRNCMAEQH